MSARTPELRIGDTVTLVGRVAGVYGFDQRDEFCVMEVDKTHAVVRALADNVASRFLANVAERRVGDSGSRWVFPREALRAAIAKARGK